MRHPAQIRAQGEQRATMAPFGRACGYRVLVLLMVVLTWSSIALCGEIHEAITKNDSAKVKELLKNDPNLVFSKDEDGFTPLHLAAANGHTGIVEFLLTTRAEVNSKDNAGSTPLHQAAAGQHNDIVELLLAQKADVDATDKHGLTPLHYAALSNNQDVVRSLLIHDANANIKDNEHGSTPLIIAVAKGNKKITELLLAHGADVNLADDYGTPLTWAIRMSHADVWDLLRQHGGHE
jgi:uncharacterized protein